jgi:hypothetical protein
MFDIHSLRVSLAPRPSVDHRTPYSGAHSSSDCHRCGLCCVREKPGVLALQNDECTARCFCAPVNNVPVIDSRSLFYSKNYDADLTETELAPKGEMMAECSRNRKHHSRSATSECVIMQRAHPKQTPDVQTMSRRSRNSTPGLKQKGQRLQMLFYKCKLLVYVVAFR